LRSASSRRPFLALVAGLAAAAFPGAAPASSERERTTVLRAIHEHRAETWRWQRLAGRPLTPAGRSAARTTSPAYRRWVRGLWRARAARARRAASRPPHRGAWLCIQRYEGSWRDAGAPYYGGLQMNLSFQRTYGRDLLRRKGTANRWTPLEQMWVAERALRRGTGFYPWPNAARRCGLL
jgi:hypothetical protein